MIIDEMAVYHEALSKWGKKTQMFMCMGECGELIAALNRFAVQGRNNESEVLEEIADVEIMIEQLRIVFGSKKVSDVKLKKLKRLSDILAGSVEHPHVTYRRE